MDGQFHTVGTLVWVWASEELGWQKGSVKKVLSDAKLEISLDVGGLKVFKQEDCPLRNVESNMGVEVRPRLLTISHACLL